MLPNNKCAPTLKGNGKERTSATAATRRHANDTKASKGVGVGALAMYDHSMALAMYDHSRSPCNV